MSDVLAERISIENLFDSGVIATLHLRSKVFMASDVRAVLTWIDGAVDGINAQLEEDSLNLDESGAPFYIVPEVQFEHGSLKISVNFKSTKKKVSEEAKNRLTTIVAAIILVTGGIADDYLDSDVNDNQTTKQEQLVEEAQLSCPEATRFAIDAWNQAHEDRHKYNNPVPFSIEIECEGQKYLFSVG